MTPDQIGGLVRTVLGILGGFILAKGWTDATTWAWLVGGVASATPALWSWFSNRPSSIAAAAQAITGVTVTTNSAASAAVVASVAAAK